MIRMEAEYELITPAFLGGADNQAGQPELRVPSIKGALRFWWRALRWREGLGVAALRDQEAALFGSADSKKGRSRVSLALVTTATAGSLPRRQRGENVSVFFGATPSRDKGAPRRVGLGATYLGYGVIDAKGGKLERGCLDVPLRFRLQLLFDPRPDADSKDVATLVEQITCALKALGTLGGLGARSRRGFGSVALRSLRIGDKDMWKDPASATELVEQIKVLHRSSSDSVNGTSDPSSLPEWTALSARAHHVVLVGPPNGKDTAAMELLDRVGQELVRFRSYGRNGKILDREDATPLFGDDHDLFKDVINGQRPQVHPRRAVFGLPHNYYSSHDGKKMDVQPGERGLDRRGSPLLLHVHRCGDRPVAVLSFLPARFLPDPRDRIGVDRYQVPLRPDAELWRPITDFLARVKDPLRRDKLGIVDAYPVTVP